jgi:hypothetical protein
VKSGIQDQEVNGKKLARKKCLSLTVSQPHWSILSGERKLSCSIVQPKNLDGHHVETLKGLICTRNA